MSMFRTLVMIASLAAAATAFADDKKPDKAAEKKPPPEKAPEKPTDKAPEKAADKAPPPETISDAEAKQFLAYFDKLVDIVVSTKDDCAKMATALNAHITANQALLKELGDAKNKGKHLPPAIKERISKRSTEEMAPALSAKCAKDKPVISAFSRMLSPSP